MCVAEKVLLLLVISLTVYWGREFEELVSVLQKYIWYIHLHPPGGVSYDCSNNNAGDETLKEMGTLLWLPIHNKTEESEWHRDDI